MSERLLKKCGNSLSNDNDNPTTTTSSIMTIEPVEKKGCKRMTLISLNNFNPSDIRTQNKNNHNKNNNANNNTTAINTRAQRRWRLLARALTRSPELQSSEDCKNDENRISVRRFTNFGLVNPYVLLENAVAADPESTWYEYNATIGSRLYTIEIREINKIFTANELIGFNNTGNICVWPSEECLAHYLLTNPMICENKTVLELGGGMSCLAGVFVGKYCNPSGVTLTDGNVTSVDNARCIVQRNKMPDFIKCAVVQWERAADDIRQDNANANHVRQTWSSNTMDEFRRTEGLYDVILSADCLFFDEARLDLVETIYGWLSEDGVALIVAPRRGSTFQKFTDAAIQRGFLAKQKELYDHRVWSRHLELVEHNEEYCPDLHYPVLLELTKQKPPG